MVDGGKTGKRNGSAEKVYDTKYKLSETAAGKGKDGHQDLPQKSSRCFKHDPCLDPLHPEHLFQFDWESYHRRIDVPNSREKRVLKILMRERLFLI
jgi:hypothetical protein